MSLRSLYKSNTVIGFLVKLKNEVQSINFGISLKNTNTNIVHLENG